LSKNEISDPSECPVTELQPSKKQGCMFFTEKNISETPKINREKGEIQRFKDSKIQRFKASAVFADSKFKIQDSISLPYLQVLTAQRISACQCRMRCSYSKKVSIFGANM
jgi:hypothetical protein